MKLFRYRRLFLAEIRRELSERSRKSLIPLTSGFEFDLCRADLDSSSGTCVAGREIQRSLKYETFYSTRFSVVIERQRERSDSLE